MSPQAKKYFVGANEIAHRKPCRYCDAELVWVKTDSGKAMPLDYASRETVLGGGWHLEVHWGRCPGTARASADAARRRAARGS